MTKGLRKRRSPQSPYFVEDFLDTNAHPDDEREYVMYHGTTAERAEEIKMNGFTPSNAAGHVLGAGVYVSRDIRKAMQYPQGLAKSKRRVLKLKVNVGRVMVIDRMDHPMMKTWHAEYDSAWLKPGVGTHDNQEEDCIKDPSRIKVVAVMKITAKNIHSHLSEGIQPVEQQVYIMYHGTTKQSAQKIWAKGFTPSADGMLGRGVYVSRDIQKAIKYPIKDGIRDSDRVVLKLRVNVGKVKAINGQHHPMQNTWHEHGYDTAWVPPGVGMVESNQEEDCVFDPMRIKRLAILKVPILRELNPSLKKTKS